MTLATIYRFRVILLLLRFRFDSDGSDPMDFRFHWQFLGAGG